MIKATIICTPGCEGVDLHSAGAVIVTMTGDLALTFEGKITSSPPITHIFRRDLGAFRRIAR